VNLDTKLANDVCARDDAIDRMKHDVRVQAEKMIEADPTRTRALLRLLAVSRNLERIADCATNIAEDVIYMIDGRIIRHSEGE
jgi:phosphate transport system protein